MNFPKALILFIFCFIYLVVSAQIPSDLSKVRASQISDVQLLQMFSQAKASGLTPDEIEAELLKRGLPSSEMSELKLRMQMLDTSSAQVSDPATKQTANTKRSAPTKKAELESTETNAKKSKIFGAELFSGDNLSFEPDLRMATPKNYTLGPDDELILNIYGVNISQQILKVSTEGTVNVKYAGIINVNGISVDAATALLKSRLTKYYPALTTGKSKLVLSLGNIRSIRVILIGAINRPGTYTLPSLATLFNALYVSGGPIEYGSFRNIELIRNNKIVQVADLYDFLLKGDQHANVSLEDNDVIRIPYASMLVTLNGELNRPGIYEMKEKETLMDAMAYAGGYKSKAFRGRITGTRYAAMERSIIDIGEDSIKYYLPKNGDEYTVDSVIYRYQNRVTIKGAVFKPGEYALEEGMTLKALIDKAQGFKEDVFTGRGFLVRTKPNLTREIISIDLIPVILGQEKGLQLVKEDSIYIASIFDLRDTSSVTINGAVRKPGTFRFEDSLSLKLLILKAGGFAENATGTGIEITRRKRDIEVNKSGSKIVEVIKIDDDKLLSGSSEDVILKPYDIVTVKFDPHYHNQIMVKVSGEVMMPATYGLQSREERLSSLISRSGGLLYTADIRGAKLIRQRKEVIDTVQVRRLLRTVEKDSKSSEMNYLSSKSTDVAIDLDFILKHPGSEDDITLEEGDELVIPRINNTVSINGEVFKPLDIMYEGRKKMKDYLSDAGGVTQLGKKNKAFVIYANGSSASIKKTLLVFKRYPKIYPGSNIFVPKKPLRETQYDVAKVGILISAVTALITAMALIFQ